MQQKLLQYFFTQEVGVSGNNVGKEPQTSRTKLKKYIYSIFTENVFSSWNPIQVVVSFANVY